MFRNNKRGSIIISIVIVIALFIIIGQIVNLASRECSYDDDCTKDSYCGSDFQCHKYPTIYEANYIPAAFIIGICFIVAAIILRWKKAQ